MGIHELCANTSKAIHVMQPSLIASKLSQTSCVKDVNKSCMMQFDQQHHCVSSNSYTHAGPKAEINPCPPMPCSVVFSSLQLVQARVVSSRALGHVYCIST